MIGPPFSLSICPSVYLSVSLSLTVFHPHALSFLIICIFFFLLNFTLCLCFLPLCLLWARLCNVSAPASHHWSAVFLLSSLPCDWVVSMHVILPTNYLWKQVFHFKGDSAHRHRYLLTHSLRIYTHTHTHFAVLLFICFYFWCCLFHIAACSHICPHHYQCSRIRVFCLSLSDLQTQTHRLTLWKPECDERGCKGQSPRCFCKLACYSEFKDLCCAVSKEGLSW